MTQAGSISIGLGAILIMGIVSFGPSPRIWHRRIIHFRAACLVVPEMWRAAVERGKSIYPEMFRRVKEDV